MYKSFSIILGGISIQHECDQYTKHHGQLSEGEVFCSGPGSLHCKHIVHAVGPIWQGGRNKEEGQLYDCVTTSLEETDKRNLSSIAIPALCTGIFGYPASEATKVITESVRDYFKRPHSSSIKTVFLCDIVTSTVDLFVKAANKFFNQPDSKYHSTPGRGRSANRFEGDFYYARFLVNSLLLCIFEQTYSSYYQAKIKEYIHLV